VSITPWCGLIRWWCGSLISKDISSVPAAPNRKQQHVVEVLDTVDMGTSILLGAQDAPRLHIGNGPAQDTPETLKLHAYGDGCPRRVCGGACIRT
jgi:hypothetical protein